MEFRKVKMGDICEIVTDYVANGSFKSLAENVKYSNKGYARVIRLVDYNNKFDKKDSIWISKDAYEFLKKSKLNGGEIILTNVGANLGTVFIAPKLGYPQTLGPNSIMIKTKENDIFIYYLLLSKYGQNKIKEIVSGSAMPKFNKTDFKNIIITIPSIENQNKIVKVLSSIDKKIELNNQINNNLDEMGLTLIKKYINQVNNEIELKRVIKFIKGKKPDIISQKRIKNHEKYLTIACLNGQELNYADTDKMIISNNDLLMVMDGASCGDIYYSDSGIVGSTLAKVNIIDDNYRKGYIYFCIRKYANLIKSKNTGSAIPHTDKAFVGNLLIPKIDINKQKKFEILLNKIQQTQKENEILIQLRNALLPKLMNGKIDLEKIKI